MAKYGIGDQLHGEMREIGGSVWWRDLWLASEGENNWFESCVRIRVGEGGSTLFWEERWFEGEVSLQQKYKRLYEVSLQHNYTVKQMGMWVGEVWTWKLSWRRNLFV